MTHLLPTSPGGSLPTLRATIDDGLLSTKMPNLDSHVPEADQISVHRSQSQSSLENDHFTIVKLSPPVFLPRPQSPPNNDGRSTPTPSPAHRIRTLNNDTGIHIHVDLPSNTNFLLVNFLCVQQTSNHD